LAVRQRRWQERGLLALGVLAYELCAPCLVVLGHGWLALAAHALAAALVLRGQTVPAAGGGRASRWAAAGLVFCLPGAGALIVLLLQQRQGLADAAQAPAVLDLAQGGVAGEGEGEPEAQEPAVAKLRSIREVLATSHHLPERLEAVLALRRLPAERAVPILRLCFSDRSEDVRLLAFADLERRESKLRARLEQTARAAAQAGRLPAAWRAHLQRRLAQEHWELVYGGFVSGALQARVLEQAAEHAQAAFDLGARGPASVLLARVALRQGKPEAAERWLALAEQTGVPAAVCAPLLAEAAYASRAFHQVGGLLARASRAQLRRPGLDGVVDLWTRDEPAGC
jgi:hypothetical protein